MSGRNDVTSEKVNLRPDIRLNVFFKKNIRTSKVFVVLKTIWSYRALINIKFR